MSQELLVTIPQGNGYSEQLPMLSRVEEHISLLPGVESATIDSSTNPFTVSVVPPEKAAIVGAVLERHYGFEVKANIGSK